MTILEGRKRMASGNCFEGWAILQYRHIIPVWYVIIYSFTPTEGGDYSAIESVGLIFTTTCIRFRTPSSHVGKGDVFF